jgi:hypothetical protein
MRAPRALALVTLLSTGCSVVSSDLPPACPTVIEYPAEVQLQAATELRAMKPGVIRDVMIPDYGTMRDEARACRGETPGS